MTPASFLKFTAVEIEIQAGTGRLGWTPRKFPENPNADWAKLRLWSGPPPTPTGTYAPPPDVETATPPPPPAKGKVLRMNAGTKLQQFCVNWILATDCALASDGDSENNRPKIADNNKNFCANFVISISYSPWHVH